MIDFRTRAGGMRSLPINFATFLYDENLWIPE